MYKTFFLISFSALFLVETAEEDSLFRRGHFIRGPKIPSTLTFRSPFVTISRPLYTSETYFTVFGKVETTRKAGS